MKLRTAPAVLSRPVGTQLNEVAGGSSVDHSRRLWTYRAFRARVRRRVGPEHTRLVFISYASEDKRLADLVRDRLESVGISCWHAERDVSSEYLREITSALSSRDLRAIVVIVSRASTRSEHVQREMRAIADRGTPVIIVPFVVEDVAESDTMRYVCSGFQRIRADHGEIEDALALLVRHLADVIQVEPPADVLHQRIRDALWFSARGLLIRNLLLFTLAGTVILHLDILGGSTSLRNQSQDLANQILAPIYPKQAQAEITVVLVNDESLHRLDQPWPPRYGFHGRVLRAIRRHRPKGVFVDILFLNRREDETLPALVSAMQSFHDAAPPIPVFLGKVSGSNQKTVEELANLSIEVPIPKNIDPDDYHSRQYDLAVDMAGSPELSAAPRMYWDLVLTNAPRIIDREGYLAAPMQVFWGTHPPESNHLVDCRPPPNSIASALWRRVASPSRAVRTNCLYARTVFADELVTEPSAFSEAIAGKIVLYGMNFTGCSDVVRTATHTSIPGVFLHAMALDNLMTFGASYMRRPTNSATGARLDEFLHLAMFMTFGVALTAHDLMRHRRRLRRTYLDIRPGRELLVVSIAGALLLLLAVAAALLLSYAAFRIWAFAPLNVLGVLGISLLLLIATETVRQIVRSAT